MKQYPKTTIIGEIYYSYVLDENNNEKWHKIFQATGEKGELGDEVFLYKEGFANKIKNIGSNLSPDYNHILTLATPFQRKWLEECIKADKYIPKEEIEFDEIINDFQIY